MAQFGGQKNPPWAAQFAATAVSQPGHSGQSIDLNSLHCKLNPTNSQTLSLSIPITQFIHYTECCHIHLGAYACTLVSNAEHAFLVALEDAFV